MIEGDPLHRLFLIDGQHRVWAIASAIDEESSVPVEVLCGFQVLMFADEESMGVAYTKLNKNLVKSTPNDDLKSNQRNLPVVKALLERCPFVGFSTQPGRRTATGQFLSMATTLRAWRNSSKHMPSIILAGDTVTGSALAAAESMTSVDGDELGYFLEMCHNAWGYEQEFKCVWATPTLVLGMWLFRRLVLDRSLQGGKRQTPVLTGGQFSKCMRRLGDDYEYAKWMKGRRLNDDDRKVMYENITAVFRDYLSEVLTDTVVKLPLPDWAVKAPKPSRR